MKLKSMNAMYGNECAIGGSTFRVTGVSAALPQTKPRTISASFDRRLINTLVARPMRGCVLVTQAGVAAETATWPGLDDLLGLRPGYRNAEPVCKHNAVAILFCRGTQIG